MECVPRNPLAIHIRRPEVGLPRAVAHPRLTIGLRESGRPATAASDGWFVPGCRCTCGDQGSGDRGQPLIPGAPGFGWLVPLPHGVATQHWRTVTPTMWRWQTSPVDKMWVVCGKHQIGLDGCRAQT